MNLHLHIMMHLNILGFAPHNLVIQKLYYDKFFPIQIYPPQLQSPNHIHLLLDT